MSGVNNDFGMVVVVCAVVGWGVSRSMFSSRLYVSRAGDSFLFPFSVFTPISALFVERCSGGGGGQGSVFELDFCRYVTCFHWCQLSPSTCFYVRCGPRFFFRFLFVSFWNGACLWAGGYSDTFIRVFVLIKF